MGMTKTKSLYPAIVSRAVRWYFRLDLSLRNIEQLLLERGVSVTYESIRSWCDKPEAALSRRAKAARRKPGSTSHPPTADQFYGLAT
jgi:putative transposase